MGVSSHRVATGRIAFVHSGEDHITFLFVLGGGGATTGASGSHPTQTGSIPLKDAFRVTITFLLEPRIAFLAFFNPIHTWDVL